MVNQYTWLNHGFFTRFDICCHTVGAVIFAWMYFYAAKKLHNKPRKRPMLLLCALLTLLFTLRALHVAFPLAVPYTLIWVNMGALGLCILAMLLDALHVLNNLQPR